MISQLIISAIFQVEMSNICWVQLLKCKNVLHFLSFMTLNEVFGFWTDLKTSHYAPGNCDDHFSHRLNN